MGQIQRHPVLSALPPWIRRLVPVEPILLQPFAVVAPHAQQPAIVRDQSQVRAPASGDDVVNLGNSPVHSTTANLTVSAVSGDDRPAESLPRT